MSDDVPNSSKPLRRQVSIMNLVLVTVSVGVAAILLTAVVMSPSLSPLASVHDSDGDGRADSTDVFPDDPSEWSDSDDDGIGDLSDDFPNDGSEWNDTDGDGYGDNSDVFPDDEDEWQDSDDDGVGDNSDEFPDDSDEWRDSDGDGVGDNEDEFPNDPSESSDSDGDGIGDNSDLFPDDPDNPTPVGEFDVIYSSFQPTSIYLVVANITVDTPWDDITLSISDGDDSCQWEPASDDLNEETDEIWFYGTARLGNLLIMLGIVDDTADGEMSPNDEIMLLAYEDTFKIGADYDISIRYEPTGGMITECTCNFEAAYPPIVSISYDILQDGVQLTIDYVSWEIIWTDLTITLSDGIDTVSWTYLSKDDLDDGIEDTKDYGSRTLSDLIVTLSVVDVEGNGYAGQDDYFVIYADSFDEYTTYTMTIVYEPFDEIIGECTFALSPIITPTTQLTKSTITNGIKLTFAAVSYETMWSDISILISDGSYAEAWTNISSTDLDDGAGDKNFYSFETLGTLVIWLNVTDLAGNGYVNQGDYFMLTANSFSSTTTYTITIIYDPTASAMTSTSFTG